ncbi:hypothetical protein FEE95_11955 [Maribacter algarum]|uniref:Uncharacterized protein n=1 Tax=Maribacter algarum (ex Zhang et al. 2020) TaxID=2578118 RepID=A0A5S3PR23_9FLAO|nr:hypothetical protein [Maribacter algarum]TMM57197.1 hypothetical protein FEE95_11955 [Maribacter algarum]
MQDVPFYVSLTFILTTILTLFLFIRATNPPKVIIFGLILWLALQCYLAYSGFYLEVSTQPFRFLLAAPPALLLILGVFFYKRGRAWIKTLSLKTLTLLHIVRVPVEIVLYWFFVYKMLPELMTFSGRNFDILAGITAPIIYYLVFWRKVLDKRGLLVWNIVCLCLLLSIIFNAILSVPIPIQQFAFNQPNVAILHFPLVWLPTFVVPVVLFSHFVAIYRLSVQKILK